MGTEVFRGGMTGASWAGPPLERPLRAKLQRAGRALRTLRSYSARIMVSRPPAGPVAAVRSGSASVRAFARRQFITRNRRLSALLAAVTLVIGVAAVHVSEAWFSPGVMILPVLAGGLLLRVRVLRILFCVVVIMIA
jgi:hypothetical protein